jgi:uncharacterized damage-inducible protein DinB
MKVEDLQTLFDYSYWANGKLFDVLSRLSTEEFTQVISGSYGSVRNTMVHVLSAEWGWLDRCGGPSRGAALVASDYPTVASLTDRCLQVEAYVRGFLADLRDEDLDRFVEFSLGGGPKRAMRLGDLMQHAAVHAVHHRGQVALLLRSLGHVPGNFDMLVYFERDAAHEA